MKVVIVALVCIVGGALALPQYGNVYQSSAQFQNPNYFNPQGNNFAPTRLVFDLANGFLSPINQLASTVVQSGQNTADVVDRSIFGGGLFAPLGGFNPISPILSTAQYTNQAAGQLLQTGQNLAGSVVSGVTNAAGGLANQIPQAAANIVQQQQQIQSPQQQQHQQQQQLPVKVVDPIVADNSNQIQPAIAAVASVFSNNSTASSDSNAKASTKSNLN